MTRHRFERRAAHEEILNAYNGSLVVRRFTVDQSGEWLPVNAPVVVWRAAVFNCWFGGVAPTEKGTRQISETVL